jgi:hypothetical protein
MAIPGYSGRITSGGIGVIRYHYSADSNKRPNTPKGDQWIKEESRAYPMGLEDPRWKKEMEIQYGALGGQHLFAKWDSWKNGIGGAAIVIPAYFAQGTRLYGSYDHGWHSPAAFHIHSVDGDGVISTVWELYGSGIPAHQIAGIIKGQDGFDQNGKRFAGCPYPYSSLSYIVADPSIWNEDKPQVVGPNKSTAAIFREMGVYMIPGERGGDITVANWLHGWYWKDIQHPRYRISLACPKLIWEIGQQRHKEFSAVVAMNRTPSEDLVDKDNHGWDGLKYLLKKHPPPLTYTKPETKPGTFAWWRKHAQEGSENESERHTFRVGVGG